MNAIRSIFFAGLLAGPALATSVAPVDRECPVCSMPTVGLQLMSYSRFGEAERDLSDQLFFGPGVEICPQDLFATWPERRALDANEKSDLAAFLKDPAVELTRGEKDALGVDLEMLRGSVWWESLWARTCDARRKPDPRHQWETAMHLYYEGKLATRPWEKRLAAHFTAAAIQSLKEAESAAWPKDVEKRIFSYLRAELLRRSGKAEEAKALFAEVMRQEESFKDDEETAWIGSWAKEQSFRIDASTATAETLGNWLLEPIPDPWRDEAAAGKNGWQAHRVALDQLAERAAKGDRASSEVLWKAIARKPRNLLAVAETTEGLAGWRGADERWAKWFDELQADMKAKRLPDLGQDEPNEERVFNVLGRAVEGEERTEKDGREKLLAAVVAAAAGDGLPASSLKGPELLGELGELLKAEPVHRQGIGRVMIRVLGTLGEKKDDFSYPVKSTVAEFARQGDWKAALPNDSDAKWKSGFWRLVGGYLAGTPGAGEMLAKHPLASKDFGGSDGKMAEELLWRLFAERHDVVWKQKALELLERKSWVRDEVLSYAFATGDAELRKALQRRMDRLRSGEVKGSDKEMSLYEIMQVEDLVRHEKLGGLPIR